MLPQPSLPGPHRVMGRGGGHLGMPELSPDLNTVMDREHTGLGSEGDILWCKEPPPQTFLEEELETKTVEPLLGRQTETRATSKDRFPDKRQGDRVTPPLSSRLQSRLCEGPEPSLIGQEG